MIKSIRRIIVDQPLRSVPAAFITGDTVLAITGGITDNFWLLGGNAVGALSGAALAIGGDGGDPALRTPKQIARAEKYESLAMDAVAVQGAAFVFSGTLMHKGNFSAGEIGVGILVMAGAHAAKLGKAPLTPTNLRDVFKKNIKAATKAIADLPPYKKAACFWLISQVPLVGAYLDNGQAGYLAAVGLYVAGNLQVMRSWRAETPAVLNPA